MSEVILKELKLFFLMTGVGSLLMWIYDFLIVIRKIVPHSRITIRIEDLLYWTEVGIFLFIQVYRHNNGDFRFFFFAGIFCGIYIYYILLHKVFSKYAIMIGTWLICRGIGAIKWLIFWSGRCKIFIKEIVKKRIEKRERVSRKSKNIE